MNSQAKELVTKMKATSGISFNKAWKLVTIFVGGNDLCNACKNVV